MPRRPDLPLNHFPAADGATMAYRELGEGHPLVLIHGFFSTGYVNWVRYGTADILAEAGFRVIMPDLRAHGGSDRSHEPQRYTRDVLADDAFALIDHLGLTDYDLGGYSLGARTTVRMLVRGADPGRAVVAGMGLAGITEVDKRNEFYRGVFEGLGSHRRGSAEWRSEAFLKTNDGDPVALRLVLDTSVGATEAELAEITTPTLVVIGADDHGLGSGAELADAMPLARYVEIPGNHMSAVTDRALGVSIRDFLTR
ncbi:alpha/beta fold hydrolase [Planctomonas sp. JC2975]|uniref:alpha/beta fold hydrolase n=1 Tax=Planctomonas sp. JC2975 TaxID=2729626 RepID=UPI00197B69DA